MEGDIEARNILIERNLRLVAHIAKKYSWCNLEQDDLISIGTIGLIKGINSFKMNKIIKRSVKNPTDFVQLILTPMIETGFKGVETIHVSVNVKLNILQIRFLGIQDKEKISKIVCGCATNHFPYEENVQSRRTGTKKVSRRRKEA